MMLMHIWGQWIPNNEGKSKGKLSKMGTKVKEVRNWVNFLLCVDVKLELRERESDTKRWPKWGIQDFVEKILLESREKYMYVKRNKLVLMCQVILTPVIRGK